MATNALLEALQKKLKEVNPEKANTVSMSKSSSLKKSSSSGR